MINYLTAGESHGKYLSGILDGFPAGVKVPRAYIAAQLARRRLAPGRSARQAGEKDGFEIISGMRGDVTTGAPIALLLPNASREVPPASSLPRPGHADFAGMVKYGLTDASLIRERASARETAMRVALGSFTMRLNELLGIRFSSRVLSLGGLHPVSAAGTIKEIARARAEGDTLGGEFELTVKGAPAGLGSFSQGGRRLSARLAAAMTAINGVKGFELGGGFGLAALGGRQAAGDPELSGGLDGGITNGRDIVIRCAVKPVPGLPGGVPARDLKTGKIELSVSKTSDTTAVFAAAVIAEHAAALELAAALLEKFGGDSLGELLPRVSQWRNNTARP